MLSHQEKEIAASGSQLQQVNEQMLRSRTTMARLVTDDR